VIVRSRTVVLPWDDIDTDQIIPARFLKTTRRDGLGQYAFADRRFASDGSPREDFPLNRVDLARHRILVAGRNFGGGSSREHAAWALRDLGIEAVLSTQIADIFRTNALENGLLALEVRAATHRWLLEHEGAEVEIDLAARLLQVPGGAPVALAIEPFARYRLLSGITSLEFLQRYEADIARFERGRTG
jgi:3-isopropylmalate/(R)-2-methylmalate dehydratase small subunit